MSSSDIDVLNSYCFYDRSCPLPILHLTLSLESVLFISPSERKAQGPGPGTGAGAGQECGHWPPNTTHSFHTVVLSWFFQFSWESLTRSIEQDAQSRHAGSVMSGREAAPFLVTFSKKWTENREGFSNSEAVNFQCLQFSILAKPACKLVSKIGCVSALRVEVCKIRNWGVMWPVAGNSTQQQDMELLLLWVVMCYALESVPVLGYHATVSHQTKISQCSVCSFMWSCFETNLRFLWSAVYFIIMWWLIQ